MKKSLNSIIVSNHRSVLLLGVLLSVIVFGVVAWRTSAQSNRSDESPGSTERSNRNRLLYGASIGDDKEVGFDEEAMESRSRTRVFGVDENDGRDAPPDLTPYARPSIREDHIRLPRTGQTVTSMVVDVVVNNTDTNLQNTDTFGDSETNIAINPANTNEIVITAFSGSWGTNSPLWHSTDGGNTWTKRFTIPVPPLASGTGGCPCDQSVDYGRGNRMSGTFLSFSPTDVYSGTTTNPAAAAAWGWFTLAGTAQRTNSTAIGNTDQPWLLINRDPFTSSQDNVYVAYDDFTISPRGMRVAVAAGSNPPNFTTDNLAGFGPTGTINPGHRLAIDPTTGTVYNLFQQIVTSNGDVSRNINYMLNRSTDGGNTWTLNGSGTGILIANADSTQPTAKFGTVNALLGGVDHAAVDPTNGDVYYVYGNRDIGTGNNRLSIKRLTANGTGGLTIGPAAFVTGQVQAAIPSVAVTSNGVVGVFFYTFDGIVSGFPQFTAHLATSIDHGLTFPTDTILETFLSSATDNANTRQRVLGDYQQVKAVGNSFYGSFTGNGVPFGRTISNHDPIFFKVTITSPGVSVSGRVSISGGRGLHNAFVILTDGLGVARRVITNPFGYYRFVNVQAGATYTISVASKRYQFTPRVINVTDNLTDVDFFSN